MNINKVGVIGAGVMGQGVAQNLATSSFEVILLDISNEILQQARQNMITNMRFQGMMNAKHKIVDTESILSKITFTTDYQLLTTLDYIIENVVENHTIKKEVYKTIDKLCKADCIFAVNTSALPITSIAATTTRAQQVIGIHFMNPVPLKNTVEVIMGYHTSQQTLDITTTLLTKMAKKSIIVKDWPGFVSNRILMLTINEAVYVVQDNVASCQDVDRVFKECFEHKMGPLETADMIGLDTILYSINVLYDCFNDSKYRPCPLLKKMVDAGLYGRKSGQGFYDYRIQN